ncbi:hypothetical protein EDC04DRAFT_2889977 [Pisolithus marmoratus]|nr:hypothetical protein EDC04DRAFT_2889977 [Pisolithus marmoratus]
MASGGSDIPVQPSSQPGPLNQVAAAEMEDKCCESGALAKLIANFPPDLSLTLREVVALNVIPHILHNLDTTTMERDFVYVAYKAPQIPGADSVKTIVQRFNRQAYIEQLRLRLDGNMQFIKCYQQLRFFGDGTAHLLLTNEEHRPQYDISVLRPLLCTEPFLVGSWQLDGSIDRISNLRSSHEHSPSNCYYRMTLALGSKPLGT